MEKYNEDAIKEEINWIKHDKKILSILLKPSLERLKLILEMEISKIENELFYYSEEDIKEILLKLFIGKL